MRTAAWLAVAILVSCTAAAAVENPSIYLYQHSYYAKPGWFNAESETGYGTREASLYGTETWEEILRVRAAATRWLSFEVTGGGLFLSPNRAGIKGTDKDLDVGRQERDILYELSADAHFQLLRQAAYGIDLGLGLGYEYDYQGTSIPRARLTVGRTWGRVNLMASGLVEYPLGAKEIEIEHEEDGEIEIEEERAYDVVDITASAAASVAVLDNLRVGVEAELQDIEGFWEDDEAEGGAKMIAGPTVAAAFADNRVEVRGNAGLLVPVTYNEPTRVPDSTYQNRVGFAGRIALGVNF
jgi:hypothetical protein